MTVDPLSTLAREVAEALQRYADALDARLPPPSLSGRARVERQRAILQEIVDQGGSVSRRTWLDIAARHGYEGRGVSGFFRAGDTGLLRMDGDRVLVTERGHARLAGDS